MPAIWSLTAWSLAAGIGMLWVFRVTSNQKAIKDLKRHRSAYLLEMRLFGDEPLLIFKSQWALVTANIRYLGFMMAPFVVMLLPMIVLLVQLDAYYGKRPLEIGRPALVTLQYDSSGAASASAPRLEAPEGLVVEGPAVRAVAERQVSWRVRPAKSVDGALRISVGGAVLEKHVAAGEGPKYLTSRRQRAWADYFWEPGEWRLPAGPVQWIEVSYPPVEVHGLGVDLHWILWFLLISMVAALLLRGRMKVTF